MVKKSKTISTKRSAKSSYAFVCDGQTESWYINMLQRNEPNLQISLKPELAQKKDIAEQYSFVKELVENYELVFWIVDMDVVIKETREHKGPKDTSPAAILQSCLNELDTLAEIKDKVVFIPNTPCLEFWILLHFIRTTKYYATCDSVVTDLRKYDPVKDYDKSSKYYTQSRDIYKRLKPYLDAAKTNSSKIGSLDFSNLEQGRCGMYKIFEKLNI